MTWSIACPDVCVEKLRKLVLFLAPRECEINEKLLSKMGVKFVNSLYMGRTFGHELHKLYP